MAAPTTAAIMRAAEADEDVGWCAACGKKAHGVEPDARRYDCGACGKPAVHGWMVWLGAA